MDSKAAMLTLARFAERQWGLVTSAQATTAGVNYMQIKRMADSGLLEKVGASVYLLIGGRAALGRNRAHKVAWLRLDPAVPAWERPLLGPDNGVVSHRSAAVLLRLGDLVVEDVELTTPRRRSNRDPSVRIHVGRLQPYEVTWADGLPVTTAVRTLIDLLASGIPAPAAGTFLAEALDRRMVNVEHTISEIAPFAARYHRPAGDGEALVEYLLDSAATRPGQWERERTVADLARELLRLSGSELQSLRSFAAAAREPAIAALVSRLAAQDDSGRDTGTR